MDSSFSEKTASNFQEMVPWAPAPDVGEKSTHRAFEIWRVFGTDRSLIYVSNDVETNLSQQVSTGPEPSGSLVNFRVKWLPSAQHSLVQRGGML